MRHFKRILYYLVINVLVSACTIFAVLSYWEQTHPPGGNPLAAGSAATPTPASALVSASTAAPEPSSTARPLTTYAVQPGDTLGEIAMDFGVTVEELMEINSLDDPSVLGSGQIIYVPLLPTEEPTPGLQPTGALTETQVSSTAAPSGLVIITNVFGAGDLASERVRLERRGEGDVPLEGWQLRDQDGNVYIFPALVLFENGAVNVYTSGGVNGVAALYWGLASPAWSIGERVELFDPFGVLQATFEIP